MADAPNLRLNFGLVLLSLHKPLDIAEQIASVNVMSGGKVIHGVALGGRIDKRVTLESEQGAPATVIDAGGQSLRVIVVADGVVVGGPGKGFTLTRGDQGADPADQVCDDGSSRTTTSPVAPHEFPVGVVRLQ